MIIYGFRRHSDIEKDSMNGVMNVMKLGSQIGILLYIDSRIFKQSLRRIGMS